MRIATVMKPIAGLWQVVTENGEIIAATILHEDALDIARNYEKGMDAPTVSQYLEESRIERMGESRFWDENMEPNTDPPPAPNEAQRRKNQPVARGVLDYFPDALLAVAELSRIGNDQHNPGQPMHWAKEKSTDHADCIIRHLIDRGTLDSDGVSHTTKVAWRALALLQTELEKAKEK